MRINSITLVRQAIEDDDYAIFADAATGKGITYKINKSDLKTDLKINDAWDDLRVPATAINPPGVASDPSYDVTNMGYSFQVNDELQIIVQMPHSWKEATEINPHVHYKQTSAANVGWSMSYRIYNNNEDISALAFTDLALDDQEFTYASGTLTQINQPASMIDMTGKRISCIIEIKLKRLADSAPTDVVLTEFDIHYQVDARGSLQEYVK